MLTVAQRLLIKRVEHFSMSPFADSISHLHSVESKHYLVSPADQIEWLSIPIRHIQHLKHIKVGCFSNPSKNLSRSELLASSDALSNFNLARRRVERIISKISFGASK